MELHLVDPVAVPVMGPEDRGVGVGLVAPPEDLGRPGQLAQRLELGLGPPRPLPVDGVDQNPIVVEEVDVLEGGGWLSTSWVERLIATGSRGARCAGGTTDSTSGARSDLGR
jgi:hypothetical protein